MFGLDSVTAQAFEWRHPVVVPPGWRTCSAVVDELQYKDRFDGRFPTLVDAMKGGTTGVVAFGAAAAWPCLKANRSIVAQVDIAMISADKQNWDGLRWMINEIVADDGAGEVSDEETPHGRDSPITHCIMEGLCRLIHNNTIYRIHLVKYASVESLLQSLPIAAAQIAYDGRSPVMTAEAVAAISRRTVCFSSSSMIDEFSHIGFAIEYPGMTSEQMLARYPKACYPIAVHQTEQELLSIGSCSDHNIKAMLGGTALCVHQLTNIEPQLDMVIKSISTEQKPVTVEWLQIMGVSDIDIGVFYVAMSRAKRDHANVNMSAWIKPYVDRLLNAGQCRAAPVWWVPPAPPGTQDCTPVLKIPDELWLKAMVAMMEQSLVTNCRVFDDGRCSICIGMVDRTGLDITVLACGHVFHLGKSRQCDGIRRWWQTQDNNSTKHSCPQCRQLIDHGSSRPNVVRKQPDAWACPADWDKARRRLLTDISKCLT